jgi:thiosulfate dehydrogenase [quinone] large subunit
MRFLSTAWKQVTPLRWVVLIRLYLGYIFFTSGLHKLGQGQSWPAMLQGLLGKWAGEAPHKWYASFLSHTVLPNHEVFAYLVSVGELLVGACLLLGLFTRLACVFGAVMNFNYLMAHGHESASAALSNEAFLVMEAVIFLAAAGRSFGIDQALHKRWPRLVLG